MKEVRNDIFLDRQVTLVHLTGKRKRIEILDRRPVRGMNDPPLPAEADAVHLFPLAPFAEFLHGVVEFAPADNIHRPGCEQECFLGQDRHVRAGEYRDGRRFLRFDSTCGFGVDAQGRG